jgi:hypothetical protein
MAAPDFYDRVLEVPRPGMTTDEQFRWLYDLWQRTGGYINYIVNLQGLLASVTELNTLVGIDTNTTVQAQLNGKVSVDDIGTMAEQDADAVAITGGVGSNLNFTDSDFSGNVNVEVGSTAVTGRVGGVVTSDFTPVGNVGAAETDLMQYTLLGGSLDNDQDFVEISAWGTFAANANNKQIRIYFGASTIFDSTAIAFNNANWSVKLTIARQSISVQQCSLDFISSSNLLAVTTSYTETALNPSSNNIIKFTGTATSNDDLIQKGLVLKWYRTVS